MRRILLLDDSANIQKVVKFTFAADGSCEVKIARNESEAKDALGSGTFDAVIAYVHFSKGDALAYFSDVKKACSNVLLLAESDFDAHALIAAGFTHILRKPFVSAKLMSDVFGFWGEVVPQSGLPVPAIQPPPPPPNLRVTQVQSETTDSFEHEKVKVSPPPPPPPMLPKQPSPQPIELMLEKPVNLKNNVSPEIVVPEVPTELFKTASFAPVDVPPISGTSAVANSSQDAWVAPEITMDLASLEQTFRNTVAMPSSENPTHEGPSETEISFSFNSPKEIPIESVANNAEFSIENVAVSQKKVVADSAQASALPGDWRREMNEAIDDAVFRIIDRTVPARIDTRISEAWPNVDELVVKLRNEVAEKLTESLRTQVAHLVREWLAQNLHTIAREEVRGEIQRLVSEI